MDFNLNRVLISDEIDQKCVDVLKENGMEVVKNTKLSKAELLEEIKNFDALVVRSATKVTAEVIEAGARLQVVGRAGTGVDNIDCEAATGRGVLVINTPMGNTISAAEHTCTLICALSRHVAQGCASMKAGRWDRKLFMGNELMGKTLAIIGLGRIGREVATRMQAFGMETIGFDPIIPAAAAAEFAVEWLPLDALWPRADFITVHTPLIPQTRNLIGRDALAKCKSSVRIVNVARGGIVDEDALLDALNAGRCAGAGLDVFLEEPPTNQALVQHPRVVATPHLGASTTEAQVRVAVEVAEALAELRKGGAAPGAVNCPAAAAPASARPLLLLAAALGRLAERLSSGPLRARLWGGEGLGRAVGAALAARDRGLVAGAARAREEALRVDEEAGPPRLRVTAGDAELEGEWTAGPALTAVRGKRLSQPLLLPAGRTVTVVERPAGDVAAALAKDGSSLLALAASEDGSLTVAVSDSPLEMSGAASVAL